MLYNITILCKHFNDLHIFFIISSFLRKNIKLGKGILGGGIMKLLYVNKDISKNYRIDIEGGTTGTTVGILAGFKGLININAIKNHTKKDIVTADEIFESLEKAAIKDKSITKHTTRIYKDGSEMYFDDENNTKYKIDNRCSDELRSNQDFDEDYCKESANIKDMVVFGNYKRNSGKNLYKILAVFEIDMFNESPIEDDFVIKTGIYGLNRILFPGMEEKDRGFINPKGKKQTVPQIILIKGAPGTGKTTLAIQMLINMAFDNLNCLFWSSNNNVKAVQKIATDFQFCNKEEMNYFISQNKIVIVDKQLKALTDLKLPKRVPNNTQVLFIDSINITQGNIDRDEIFSLYKNYREAGVLSFIFLEDYGENLTYELRQTMLDCEFFADIVIQLDEIDRMGYHTFGIKIKKRHFGSQSYGTHLYKICGPGHALQNLEKVIGDFKNPNQKYENNTTGMFIYPSIHRYLSGTRKSNNEEKFVHTGITHLDEIFQGNKIDEKSMLQDSCIVIRGEKGSHKLTIGMNLLIGGMWKVDEDCNKNKVVRRNKDVLLILLDGDDKINIQKSAQAKNTHTMTEGKVSVGGEIDTLDNFQWISWIDDLDGTSIIPPNQVEDNENNLNNNKDCMEDCQLYQLLEKKQYGQKVTFKKCCAKINLDGEHAKVLIACFRPGYIMPEEFLYIISRLLNPKGIHATDNPDSAFSRVLFASTDHLRIRYPMLYSEKLFLPALIDLFKAQNVVSIFIDVIGEGSDKELTYGLSAQADYLIQLKDFSEEEKKNLFPSINGENPDHFWTKMSFDNIRGKNYSRPIHKITIKKDDSGTNILYMEDVKDSINTSYE